MHVWRMGNVIGEKLEMEAGNEVMEDGILLKSRVKHETRTVFPIDGE